MTLRHLGRGQSRQHGDVIRVLDERLNVMDATSIVMCRDNGLPLQVFNLNNAGDLVRIVRGEARRLPEVLDPYPDDVIWACARVAAAGSRSALLIVVGIVALSCKLGGVLSL